MTAIQRAVVDDLGNIQVHGREGIVVLLKIETATAGVYENIADADLFIEVSGKYRVALAAGADVYTRQVVLTRAQVAQLAMHQPVPFVVVDETPTSPRSLWAGLITSYGFRVAPTGAAVEEGVATSYAGASVIVQPDADTPTLVIRYEGPTGATGATGDTGPMGLTGAAGGVSVADGRALKAIIGSDLITDTVFTATTVDAYGATTPVTGSNGVLNRSYARADAITRPGILKRMGGYMQTAGNFELRAYRPEKDTKGTLTGTYKLISLTAITSTGTGAKTFTYTEGIPELLLIPGDLLYVKNTAGRFAQLVSGAESQYSIATDSNTLGQTGCTAGALGSGEGVQIWFELECAASTVNVDTRLDALEVSNWRGLGEAHGVTTTFIQQQFASTTTPTGWTANGWAMTTAGATSPATGAWTTHLYAGKASVFDRMKIRALVKIDVTTACHGIYVPALEASNPNGGYYEIDGASSVLKIYSCAASGTTGTLRGTSSAFSTALVAGRLYLLEVEKRRFQNILTLTDTVTQGVVCTYTLTMAVAADAGSRARATGYPGYMLRTGSGSAADVTLKYFDTVVLGKPAPKLMIFGDSVAEGPTLGADYNSTWANQIADAINTTHGAGSCIVSARGGDESTRMLARLEWNLLIFRPQYVILAPGTNDGNTATWTANLQKMILLCRAQGVTGIIIPKVIPYGVYGGADQTIKNAMNAVIDAGTFGSDIYTIQWHRRLTVGYDGLTIDTAKYDADLIHPVKSAEDEMYAQARLDVPFLFDAAPVSVPISMFFGGKPTSSELLARLELPDALTMVPARCRARAETASTGTATFTMTVDGSSVGTVVFTASTTGVVTLTKTAFAAGTFKLTAPASVDATLADISIMLSGDR